MKIPNLEVLPTTLLNCHYLLPIYTFYVISLQLPSIVQSFFINCKSLPVVLYKSLQNYVSAFITSKIGKEISTNIIKEFKVSGEEIEVSNNLNIVFIVLIILLVDYDFHIHV